MNRLDSKGVRRQICFQIRWQQVVELFFTECNRLAGKGPLRQGLNGRSLCCALMKRLVLFGVTEGEDCQNRQCRE